MRLNAVGDIFDMNGNTHKSRLRFSLSHYVDILKLVVNLKRCNRKQNFLCNHKSVKRKKEIRHCELNSLSCLDLHSEVLNCVAM